MRRKAFSEKMSWNVKLSKIPFCKVGEDKLKLEITISCGPVSKAR